MRTEIEIMILVLAWFTILAGVELTMGLVGSSGITQGILCIALMFGLLIALMFGLLEDDS